MTLHEKLMDLAERLEGEDAVTVWAAAFQLAPLPTPTTDTMTKVAPGYYLHMRSWT